MTPGTLAVWLPSLLLLLCLPGCFTLSGPSTVSGFEGSSLNIHCQYEKEYQTCRKYWCRKYVLLIPCEKIVETEDSKRKVRKDHVSITDHPANLTFTVTLDHLTLEDAGTYRCGINKPWATDIEFEVVVSVNPKPTSTTPTRVTTAKSLVPTSTVPIMLSTSLASESLTQDFSRKEGHHDHQGLSLPVLLSVLAVLLLLLVGISLLAWRMVQKQVKDFMDESFGAPLRRQRDWSSRATKYPELSQNLRQAAEQRESQYVNLQLHTWSLREEPETPRQIEVECSMVALPKEDLHYTSVVFNCKKQTSNASSEVPTKVPRGEEPEYSVIRKPRAGPSDPPL